MLHVKDSTVWKEGLPYVKSGGVWVPVKQVYTRSGGVWKEVMLLNLYQQLNKLGLTANLRLCLDAGAVASLPAGSAKWQDISGNAYDFFRGTTAGADGSDPTITGTPNGRSSNEYLSFDGGDYLQYDAANETWMNNFHKAGAKWTVATWIWHATGVGTGILGTDGNNGSVVGFFLGNSSAGKLILAIGNGSSQIVTNASVASIPIGQWSFLACSFDSSGGSTGNILMLNGTQETFSGTLSSPSASNAAFTMQIGTRGNGSAPLPNGSRMAGFMIWESKALTQAELTSIFTATRGRFGV